MNRLHLAAVEHLLEAVYSHPGTAKNAFMSGFMFGSPGSPINDRRMGGKFWLRNTELVKAALFVRHCGAPYLRDLPMEDLQKRLLDFMTENYGFIGNEVFGQRLSTSYAEFVSPHGKAALARAIAASDLFVATNKLKLYPLVPFRVQDDFVSSDFFLIQPQSLLAQIPHIPARYVNPEQFPPFSSLTETRDVPASWLGVRSPASEAADKMKATILGALALVPHRRQRFMFTLRRVFGGSCIIDNTMTMTNSLPHTPALSDDITITKTDHAWLEILADKLGSSDIMVRRQMRALEYFYRAWGLRQRERFPLLVMSIEALYSVKLASTKSVITGVANVLGPAFSEDRLRLLLAELRASVIHGRSPEVYDAEEYIPYYEAYETDPICDLELIAARCLQSEVFGGKLVEHPHPYADVAREKLGIDVDEEL